MLACQIVSLTAQKADLELILKRSGLATLIFELQQLPDEGITLLISQYLKPILSSWSYRPGIDAMFLDRCLGHVDRQLALHEVNVRADALLLGL